MVVAVSHKLGHVTIHTDDWIELDTKQLDRFAEFDDGARNFHSTKGIHLKTLIGSRMMSICTVMENLQGNFV